MRWGFFVSSIDLPPTLAMLTLEANRTSFHVSWFITVFSKVAYWNCKQCVHTVRGRKCQYIKINGPNCMLSWEYFWPGDGSDLSLAEQELILLPCYLCQHKCAAHLTSVRRERARVQGQLGPWGSCLITTWGKGKLHLRGASPPKTGLL